jgi:cell division protein FtsQ
MAIKMTNSENVKNQKNLNNRQAVSHPRRKRRRLSAFAYFLVIFTVFAMSGILAAVYFLKIDKIGVSGKTQYSQEQIISASGLKLGESVFFTDRGRASRVICERLPFIESAAIHYDLFTGFTIETKADAAVYEIKYKDGYAALDEDYKVLMISVDPNKSGSLPIIDGIGLNVPVAGLTLSEKDKRQVMQAAEILSGFKSNQINKITSINVSNDYEIKANFDGRIDILIGTTSDLSNKLKFAAYLLKNKDDISDSDKGLLDVSQSAQSNKVSFIPS